MQKLLFKSLILSILFFSSNSLFSQIKFGKISDDELAIETNSTDAEFGAVILADYGEIEINSNQLSIYQHRRIKILNKNGIEEANISLPYYAKSGNEKISHVKAQTINVDENGKIVKIPVGKKEIYTNDLENGWREKRFTFPDVKPGSIIEFLFMKQSEDLVSLDPWEFQNHLPTLNSELTAKIPGHLDYRLVLSGKRLITKYGSTNGNKWVLKNLPALKEEPYCPNPQDFIESIKFQLAGYNNGSEYVTLMSTWEELAKEILDEPNYRAITANKKKAREVVENIISPDDKKRAKVQKIYAWVQKNFTWEKKFRMFPKQKFSELMESRKGSSSEINLMLITLLRAAEFNANPVLISTKGHGIVTKVYPIYTQFNSVLAQVDLYGKDVLMDATSKYRPYDLLSTNDLNPYGYLISKKEPRWVDITLPKKTKKIAVTDFSIKEDKLIYKLNFSFFEHEAAWKRSRYKENKGEDKFITEYLLDLVEESELTLDSFSVKNETDLSKPFGVSCYFSQELEDGMDSEIIYIDALLIKHFDKNPFNNPVRYLPVDFAIPFNEKFIFNMVVPEGYELAEKPQSVRLKTGQNHCNYNFLFQETDGRIQMSSELKLVDPLIYPADYSALRELFTQLFSKQDVQIVLKKK